MGNVKVRRYQRNKKIGDKDSPLYYYLRQKADSTQIFDINRIAGEIEGIGSLSVEDVEHVIKSLVRSMKLVLRDGNRVKLDGFGTFYITFRCPGGPSADKCSIKNISRVNIRFLADRTLRLVNESTATTRNAPNNVVFELDKLESDGGGNQGGGQGGSGDGGIEDDPLG